MKKIRSAFVTGLLVLVPLFATIDLLRWLVSGIDRFAKAYLPLSVLHIDFPGVGVAIALFTVLLVGALAENYIGHLVLGWADGVVRKIAFVGGIYGAIKKFLETVFNPRSDKFSGVVLVQFPRQGIYSIGFRTGQPDSKLSEARPGLTNVFVPCTPNPTSGFYLLVEETELITLDLSVQEAFKLIISMGLVTSEHPPGKSV